MFYDIINVRTANFVQQAVGVGVEKLAVIIIKFPLHVVVVEVVDESLGRVQNAESNVDRFVEINLGFCVLYRNEIFLKDGATVKVVLCDHGLGSVRSSPVVNGLNVDVLTNVLHGLAKHCVVHELEQILFKIVLGLLPHVACSDLCQRQILVSIVEIYRVLQVDFEDVSDR